MKKAGVSKQFKKFVKECCQKCAWNLGVSHYRMDILYMEESKEKEDGYQTHAEITVDRRYMEAKIRLYPEVERFWKEGNKKRAKEIVFHEISHILTQHLYDCATATYVEEGEMKDAWETLTESVARLSLKIDES